MLHGQIRIEQTYVFLELKTKINQIYLQQVIKKTARQYILDFNLS